MSKQNCLSLLLVAGLAFAPLTTVESDVLSRMSVQQRLERLERIISSDVLIDQSQQLEALRQEVSMLRELVEEKDYELDLVIQRQRSLYSDMDRRLTNLEGGAIRVGGAAPVPPPSGVAAAAATAAPGSDKDGSQAYSAAFDLLKQGQYSKAITGFEAFLKSYPESRYADNAQYWLGEANYVSREYKTALDAFQRLIAKYPDSKKVPGAKLKIGYTYYELQNWSAAKDALADVVKSYPDTTVSSKAEDRLQRMKREGH